MAKRAFGELESQILYIMQSGERQTVRDVHKALGGKDNYNTVMTVMSRLAEKQLLVRERVGLQYEYWLSGPTKSYSFLDMIKQKFSQVRTSALVSYLLESASDLSDEEIEEMQKMLKKVKDSKK